VLPTTGARRATPREIGDAAEVLVATALAGAGWVILGRQVRVGHDELDLVAIDPGPPRELVAVEVRWRRSREFGLPEESFDGRKRHRVVRALLGLVAGQGSEQGLVIPRLPLRVDLVVVEPAAAGGVAVRHHRAVSGG